ncbi:MAG: hypothetical protein K2X87_20660 [Gemmataceae bacterium]|nr:hypothetical protein [Gemmataceae bacterium]
MSPAARGGVAEATLAYFPIGEARRVAEADRIGESMLSDDPVGNSGGAVEGLHRLVVSPLVFLYEVHPTARLVRVTAVRYFRV